MKIVIEIDPDDPNGGSSIKFTPGLDVDPKISAALDRLEQAVRARWAAGPVEPAPEPAPMPRRSQVRKKSTRKKATARH